MSDYYNNHNYDNWYGRGYGKLNLFEANILYCPDLRLSKNLTCGIVNVHNHVKSLYGEDYMFHVMYNKVIY